MFLVALCCVVVRCDILVFAAPLGLYLLLVRRMRFTAAVLSGGAAVIVGIGASLVTVVMQQLTACPCRSVCPDRQLLLETVALARRCGALLQHRGKPQS